MYIFFFSVCSPFRSALEIRRWEYDFFLRALRICVCVCVFFIFFRLRRLASRGASLGAVHRRGVTVSRFCTLPGDDAVLSRARVTRDTSLDNGVGQWDCGMEEGGAEGESANSH